MADLSPIYRAVREAKQAEAESSAGDLALAQFGSFRPEPEPITVNTDVEKIDTSKVPGPGQKLPTSGGTRFQVMNPLEPDPEAYLRRGLAVPEQTGTGMLPIAEKLGEYLANVNNIAELQQKLSSPEGIGLLEALKLVGPPVTPGLSALIPITNAVMRKAREVLEAGGVPEPYVTIGEFAAALLVPNAIPIGPVSSDVIKIMGKSAEGWRRMGVSPIASMLEPIDFAGNLPGRMVPASALKRSQAKARAT
jgi:hypothetical protein